MCGKRQNQNRSAQAATVVFEGGHTITVDIANEHVNGTRGWVCGAYGAALAVDSDASE